MLKHVASFAKSDLRFSDKNIALQKKRSKSTRSFFSDIFNLCSRPVSIYEILFNVFSDLHKLESFNPNEIKNYNRYIGDGEGGGQNRQFVAYS